jgi:hypothetical protein
LQTRHEKSDLKLGGWDGVTLTKKKDPFQMSLAISERGRGVRN